ncbi:MAG: prepilin-type N-terminal cleavage/methylation domain-containing protein [Lacisediminihabitans sp.]
MKFDSENRCSRTLRDDGLSLIEVIVAIAIISIVALASASLTINGVSLASSTERQQVAVTIANGAMETASAQAVATIYSGRKSAAVMAAFASNAAVPGVSATNPVADTSLPIPATQALPISPPPITQSGTTYTTTILAGSCFQPRSGGDCLKPATAGYIPLIRIIVVVRWNAGDACAASGCSYSTTTLIDPGKDLEWVTHD